MRKFNNYSSVEIDSRKCNRKSIFVCIKNDYIDNTYYLNDAINRGATLIISEHRIYVRAKVIYVKDIYPIFKKLLDYFYPYNLELIGVTGTDGKTSTCLMIQSLINQNSDCGYIGTNGIIYNLKKYNTINTTPDIITIRKHLSNMTKENIKYVVMECSSEGILSNRLFSLSFDCLIYTNITHEHLNTHKTMKNYIKTKFDLMSYLKRNGSVFVNADDKNLFKLKHKNIKTYGLSDCDCRGVNVKLFLDRIEFKYILNKSKNPLVIPFFGKYNVYNCLAAVLVLDKYNLLENTNFMYMKKISGRFELINTTTKQVVIDFAHTPNALENLLKNIKQITKKKIVLVLGSSGGKDKSKRPMLGSIANHFCDKIIITSEDPKNESIVNIFHDLTKKIKKEYYLVLFRKDAIKLGLELLDKDSILVIVGKGVENYEQIYNIKFPHNDYLYTKSLLNA
ncbi:MAG: UDP-N-acetylmuramyl-tripeptide synthetase [bacterium]